MRVETHKRYDKAWAKLTKAQQSRALAALRLLMADPRNPKLRIHQLHGEHYPHYSVSAGGDLRIHYLKLTEDHIVLMIIGTHSQLY